MAESLIKEYLLPARVVEASTNIENVEALLENRCEQISFNEDNVLRCQGTGYLILDFGKDLGLVSKVLVYLRNTYSHCIPSLNGVISFVTTT